MGSGKIQPIPFAILIRTCFTILVLTIFGIVNELFRIRMRREKDRKGYASLYDRWPRIYKDNFLARAWFVLNTPICSPPGPKIEVIQRESRNNGWSIEVTDQTKECYNLGSFNYLNLSDTKSPTLPKVIEDLREFGSGLCSPRSEFGTTISHIELENALADFLGVERVLTFGMGYATNAFNIPTLMDENTLILSDEFNHASIINGLKLTRAKMISFQHNDMADLEMKLREGIASGQVSKAFIIVEGVYSMHGTICKLPEIVRIKRAYGAYLYLDEAHSIGCLGATGRGVTEYFGIDPREVDIMMATLAKSFGASGGYIGGSKKLINLLLQRSIAHKYGTAMPVPITSFLRENTNFLLNDPSVSTRVADLCRISRYFRNSLKRMGYIVYGDDVSAVIAIVIPFGILPYIIYYMRNKNVCLAGVGWPATPLMEGRVRCCMNAMNSKENIDYVLECFESFANRVNIGSSNKSKFGQEIEY